MPFVRVKLLEDGTDLWVNPRHVAAVGTIVPDEDEPDTTETIIYLDTGNDHNVKGDAEDLVDAINEAETD